MKKQSFFVALMAAMAMGVVFASCTNADNPCDTPTIPDGKYVMLKDSIVYSDGDTYIDNWEYDAEGKMVKETSTYCYVDGTTGQIVYNYTYTPGLITCKESSSNGDNQIYYYRLNNKGLIEQVENVSVEEVLGYYYNDDNRLTASSLGDDRDTIVWKNYDVEEYDYVDFPIYFTYTNYEVDFPYMIYGDFIDDILAQMGYYGKPTRHLMSNYNYDLEDDAYTDRLNSDFSYVVRNGLVMEYTETVNRVITWNGESYDLSYTAHHYITWEKH